MTEVQMLEHRDLLVSRHRETCHYMQVLVDFAEAQVAKSKELLDEDKRIRDAYVPIFEHHESHLIAKYRMALEGIQVHTAAIKYWQKVAPCVKATLEILERNASFS